MILITQLREISNQDFFINNTTSNYYEEQRKPKWGKFFDNSKTLGKQSLENRLDLFKGFTRPWSSDYSDDKIRIFLKKELFSYNKQLFYLKLNESEIKCLDSCKAKVLLMLE